VGRVLEAHLNGFVFHRHGIVAGAQRAEAFTAVGLGQGQQGQAGAARLLAHGVDAGFLADVEQHGHARVGHLVLQLALGVADESGVILTALVFGSAGVVEGRNLGVVEREIAYPPLRAPLLHHGGKELGVLVGPVVVRLALVPNSAFNAVALNGVQHAVIQRSSRAAH
nr:hypothetical protein [Tanacetum cinerariifolium]